MSFSSDVKTVLSGLTVKKNCCKKALLLGLLSAHTDYENQTVSFYTDNEKVSTLTSWVFRQVYGIIPYYDTAHITHNTSSYFKMKTLDAETHTKILQEMDRMFLSFESFSTCQNCIPHFIRGLFLASGTVSDPTKKGYHLEFLITSEKLRSVILSLFETVGLFPKMTTRKGSLSLYFKNSNEIEDLLTVIGAPHAALELMNAKIMREIRNNENRRSNCDASNIYRSTGAADTHLRAIKRLIDSGKLSLLPTDLQTTAKIRMENPECSLMEIAALHEPPLTKSGVNHRMQRIVKFANEEE